MPYNIEFSSYNGRFLYNKCLSESRTNRRTIAMQGFTIADAEIHMSLHNSWTCICDRLPYICIYIYIHIHMVTPPPGPTLSSFCGICSQKKQKILFSFLCDLHTPTQVRYRLTLVFLQFLNCHLVAPHPKTPKLPFPSK